MDFEQVVKASCPNCLQYGKNSRLIPVHYKINEAFYTCEDRNCIYFVTDASGNPIKYKHGGDRKRLIPIHTSEPGTRSCVSIRKDQIDSGPQQMLLPFQTNPTVLESTDKSSLPVNAFENNCPVVDSHQKNALEVNAFDADEFFKTDNLFGDCHNESALAEDFLKDFVIN